MDFYVLSDVSEDVFQQVRHITNIALAMKSFFQDKNYGKAISTFSIGIICVAPEFEFCSKERKKYKKSEKKLLYDIKLNHSKFKTANEKEIKEMLNEEIMKSLGVINELKITDFDTEKFRSDLKLFFQQY